MKSQNELRAETINVVAGLIRNVIGEQWAQEIDINENTLFGRDLELESIEFVELAEKLRDHYQDRVDFVGWLANKDIEQIIQLTVGNVVEHIVQCLSKQPTE